MLMNTFIRIIPICTFLSLVGCMENSKTYEIGSLKFQLPEEYVEISKKKDQINSRIPDQPPTIEHVISFQNSAGRNVYLFFWQGFPWRDYGPMVKKKSYPVNIAGKETSMIRTKQFMGSDQEVLVVHFKLNNDENLMIYTPDMKPNEFKKFLEAIF